jgi:hypothetical protein
MEAEDFAKGTFDETWGAPSGNETTGSHTLSPPLAVGDADQGPCLYLGPNGQRCDRRALAGGYCASHRPGAISLPKVALSKRTLAAIVAISGILWPFLADLVREIIRWMHSH